MHLKQPVHNFLFHLVERWPDLVRSQHDPEVSASTKRLEGWFGRFKPKAHLSRGFGTPAGILTSCA